MEPTTEQVPAEQSSPKKKVILFVSVGVIFLILALGIFYVVVFGGGGVAGEKLRSILPFGEGATDVTQTGTEPRGDKLGDADITGEEGVLPRMWKIAEGPVSGSIFKTLPDGTLSVRYVMREDGDIHEYSIPSHTGRILANNAVPRVAEAVWDARGGSVVLRTATEQGDIVSVLGKLLPNPATSTGDEAPAVMRQSFLPENIDFITPGPVDGFVHTLRVGNELSIMRIDGAGQSTPIFTSPFTEWVPVWVTEDRVDLFTRPSGLVGGYFFDLSIKTGIASPLLGDFTGLTAKSAPNGGNTLIGGARKNILTFGILGKDMSQPEEITPSTLPEKCAWTASSTFAYCGVPQSPPTGVYPDDWYQGVAQFSDTIWVYGVEGHQFALFLIPKDVAGIDVDVTNPVLSLDGAYMSFINKKDGSLWGIRIAP